MHNDVSFVVHRARDLGRVGSRPRPNLILQMRGASRLGPLDRGSSAQACSVHHID